jgi:peptidoglycan/xylan/chitin deacetylase (PgdA/CDA1 family)
MIWILMPFILIILIVQWRYNFFTPKSSGLPILMYHKVDTLKKDFLTVNLAQLSSHFNYLKSKGYQPISFQCLLQNPTFLPSKPIIITFDDGFMNNFEFLYPLLQQFDFKATIFLPVSFIGKTNLWDGGADALMDYKTLKNMDSRWIEFGLHSFAHKNYKTMEISAIDEDLKQSIDLLKDNDLSFAPVLAYPFGGFPREKVANQAFEKVLLKNNILLGLRIGNKINALPLRKPYQVKRIDVRGTDSFWAFKTKLHKGRVKMF